MNLNLQYRINQDTRLKQFLRENSYWYKILNRDPDMFNEFVSEVKKNYKLRPSDKINEALNTFEMISSIFGALK